MTGWTVRDPLREAMTVARRDKDLATLRVLRSAMAAIENAEAVPTTATAGAIEQTALGVGAAEAERRVLSEDQERSIVGAEVTELEQTVAEHEQLGAPTDDLERRLAVLRPLIEG